MRVVICGAGQVGYGIAERLAAEDNDVSVIDTSPQLVQAIRDTLDVRGFVGHGAHPEVLAQAGAEQADMIIAVTLYDEVNMVACQVAHSLFNVPTKIARIRAQSYLAAALARPVLRRPPADRRDHLAGDRGRRDGAAPAAAARRLRHGRVRRRRGASWSASTCSENCPVVDTPLSQLTELFPDLQAVVVGIVRDGKLFVPRSADSMLVGDQVYVVCQREQVRRTLGIFGHEEQVAKPRGHRRRRQYRPLTSPSTLEARGAAARVKIIESTRERAVAIADAAEAHRRPARQRARPGDPARGRRPGRRHADRAHQRRRGQHHRLRHGQAARLPQHHGADQQPLLPRLHRHARHRRDGQPARASPSRASSSTCGAAASAASTRSRTARPR